MSYSNNWLQTISEAYKSKTKKKEKAYVEEDTETLLAIIEVLCEELNIDVNVLMEQMTIKDWKNLGHAHEWDKPAPAAAPHGKLAADERDRIMARVLAKGTRSERIAQEREQFRAGPDFAERIADAGENYVHEPEKTGGVVKGLKALRGFDKIQSDIDDLAYKSRMADEEKKMSPTMKAHVENLRRLAKPAAKKTNAKPAPKKTKGKKKK